LALRGSPPIVVEQSGQVGGIACTMNYKGFRFDMGGHRFFTRVAEVDAIWRTLLGDDFRRRPRLSRIWYSGRFVDYPLKPLNVLASVGVVEGMLILASYGRSLLSPQKREDTFAQWVSNRFGRRLFRTFFKSYTEKVWGVSTDELSADWAAQRIKNLSLFGAIKAALSLPGRQPKSLIEEFDYPVLGPGMMWEAASSDAVSMGCKVDLGTRLVAVRCEGARATSVTLASANGNSDHNVDHLISSIPLAGLIGMIDPPPPPAVLAAARALRYRSFVTVCLIVDRADLFADNWIYVHDPSVRVARIQNYKNWSPQMVPNDRQTSLGLEYFCEEGDALWSMSESELVAMGSEEVERIGICDLTDVSDGCVFKVAKAYPLYDSKYRGAVDTLKHYIDGLENVQTIGRNGLHRYDNQDHAMLAGLCAARNLLDDKHHDVWDINVDDGYHETAAVEDGSINQQRNTDPRSAHLTSYFSRQDG
jgi:protoporphyrinogen oxidase